MLPRTLKEIISVSRKAAKEFKQSLEELGELLREGNFEGRVQRAPVRVPVQNARANHPLAGRITRRQFSTSIKREIRNPTIQLHSFKISYRRQPLTNSLKNVIYQVQPFKVATRVTIRGGVGGGMYKHFTHHNARMFSTFGGSSSAQAAQNLSQGIRTFILKGGQLSIDCVNTKINAGTYITSEAEANQDIQFAGRVSNDDYVHQYGSFVEFNINSPSVDDLLPTGGIFDEDLSKELEYKMESALKYQGKVISDIGLFRDNIGSTSFKCSNGRLRFYCPNCEVSKMELLLTDHGITTGIVHKITIDDNQVSLPMSRSFDSVTNSESGSYNSVLSSCDSFSSIEEPSYLGESVLSESDNYFETAVIV